VADGRAPVIKLAASGVELAWLAVAGAEVAVIEAQHAQAGIGETLGERRQTGGAGATETVGHDHAGVPAASVRVSSSGM